MEKRIRKTNLSKIIPGLFIVAFLVAGGIFLYKTAYEQGKIDGRKNYESETSALVKNLATAVAEKSSDFGIIQSSLNYLPSELNEESINEYLDALSKIELKNAEGKTILESYKDAWQAMKTIYEAGDNDKIRTEYETLKNTANETAKKLQTLYDSNISSTLEKL